MSPGPGGGRIQSDRQRVVRGGVLTAADAEVLIRLAGFRNRIVHFYHAIGDEELRLICRDQLGDIEQVDNRLRRLRARGQFEVVV